MNLTVWKYELKPTDISKFAMPKGSRILSCQTQGAPDENGIAPLMLWALVNPSLPKENRYFNVVGTGNPLTIESLKNLIFIDTIQFAGGQLVFHIFERLIAESDLEPLGMVTEVTEKTFR